jgi:hypothetical protein
MQEHYRLSVGVCEAKASLVFNNVPHKVIKDASKHALSRFVASYYTQVNLFLFCTHVLKLFFYFDMQM